MNSKVANFINFALVVFGLAKGATDAAATAQQRANNNIKQSKESVIQAIDFAMQKYPGKIRKISQNNTGTYYEAQINNETLYLYFFSNGSIKTKGPNDKDWKEAISPQELSNLYSKLDKNFHTGVDLKKQGFQLSDFESAVTGAMKVPGSMDAIRPK